MLFLPLMRDILMIAIQFATVLFAISIHESAHAWMADRCGDPTARLQGRISLNPVAHIDPIGTIIFPILLALMRAPVFGWAKPVMVNPYNFRDPRRDNMKVAAAGPISNLLTAFVAIVVFIILKRIGVISLPLSGVIGYLLYYLININIFLAIFNLIPVPPLDGSGIIEGLLKGEALRMYQQIRPYGFIILLLLLYLNVLHMIARPILSVVERILVLG